MSERNNNNKNNNNKNSSDAAYSAFRSVDARVAKPVLGSDAAAAWQSFQKQSNTSSNRNAGGRSSVAPTAPLKAVDRAAGFGSWQEERRNEERVRREAGDAAVSAGYTHFRANKNDDDGGDDSKLTRKERQRIEKRLLAEDQEYFLPSKTWRGPKWDYVFTTKPHHGTGYYFDGMDSLKKLRGEITDEEAKAVMNAAAAGVGAKGKRSLQDQSDTTTIPADDEKELKKKKKKKSKKGEPTAVTIVHDPTNPLQQVAEALQRKRQQQQQWQTAVDPGTGKTYYYNPLSGERSWDRPLPAGWQVTTDTGTGKEYYYHAETGVTAWERPA